MSIYTDEPSKGLLVYYARYATDDDLEPLFDLDNVMRLQLSHADISDAGLVSLKQLRGLRSVYIPRCRASAAAAAELQEALPRCTVYHTPRRFPFDWGKLAFGIFFWGSFFAVGYWLVRVAWRRVDKHYLIRQKAFGVGILLMLGSGLMFVIMLVQALGYELTVSDLVDLF
ncbi:MAG: hypothetical protein JNM56_02360 [Planctomycetia bacterium]|nr:hypothetical protein [Planctomycetia bacterium]